MIIHASSSMTVTTTPAQNMSDIGRGHVESWFGIWNPGFLPGIMLFVLFQDKIVHGLLS